jgi:peroxiredoxin
VPEDRLGDLGRDSAAERFADLDRAEPEKKPPRRQEPGRSYMWVVGVAGVIVIAIVAINSLPNAGRGSSGPVVGKPIPKFAAPSAAGSLKGDPNVKQSADDDGAPNKTPACDVPLAGALRSCDYTSKPLVLTFIVPGAKDCEKFADRLELVQKRHTDVNFVLVVSGASEDRVRSLVAGHHWTFPVAIDRNLAVFNTYRVSLCATSVFAYRGGIVRGTKIEAQHYTDPQLEAAIRATESPVRGSSGPEVGKPVPKFAAPSAAGSLNGDPNVKQSPADTSATNQTPACDVHVAGALRSCDYTSKPLVLTFIRPGVKECVAFADRLQRVRARYPGVNFVTVVSGTPGDRVRRLVADHHWTLPVAIDRNLAVLNKYRVSLCGTTVFAKRGGVVRATKVEAQRYSDAELNAAIQATR